jgi:hypothetical protein
MKTFSARTFTVVSLAVLLLAGAAYGQYVQHIVKLSVPFEFTVNDENFPAGEYSIVCVAPNRLDLRDARNHVVAQLLTHSVESRTSNPTTRLDFSTAEGGHALSQIWLANDRIGYELPAIQKRTMLVQATPQQSGRGSGAGNK